MLDGFGILFNGQIPFGYISSLCAPVDQYPIPGLVLRWPGQGYLLIPSIAAPEHRVCPKYDALIVKQLVANHLSNLKFHRFLIGCRGEDSHWILSIARAHRQIKTRIRPVSGKTTFVVTFCCFSSSLASLTDLHPGSKGGDTESLRRVNTGLYGMRRLNVYRREYAAAIP